MTDHFQNSPQPTGSRQSNVFWKRIVGRCYNKIIFAIEIVADLLTAFLSFTLGAKYITNLIHPVRANLLDFYHLAVFASLFIVFLFDRNRLYKQQLSLMNIIETRKIIKSFIILVPVLYFYSSVNLSLSYTVMTLSCGLAFTMIITERMIIFKLQQAMHLLGINEKYVVIVGANPVAQALYQNIVQSPKLGYTVIGFFDEDQHQLAAAQEWSQQSKNASLFFEGDLKQLDAILAQVEPVEIFLAQPHLSPQKMGEFMAHFTGKGIVTRYIPYLYDHFVERIHMMEVNGIPLFSGGRIEISMAEQVSKRLFDLLLSLIAMILFSPLFVLLAILIRRDSPGAVFFKQTRIGKDGVPFSIIKFRTMHVDAPVYEKTPSTSRDPRITRVGRILRKTSLDELPQLINVLRGEMSLVGPRPEMPFVVAEYNPLQQERLRVKPGITGVWQISGDRTRPIHENMSYDIFYIKNRSILLDVIILCRTILWGIASMKTH